MMDELIFRSSQKLDTLNIQLGLAASRGKDAFVQYSEQGKHLLSQALNNPSTLEFREKLREVWIYIVDVAENIHYKLQFHMNPRRIYLSLVGVLGKNWSGRDVCFGLAGFFIGGMVGIAVGLMIKQKPSVIRYMKAVQCKVYLGPESVAVVEDAIAPSECSDNEVLVDVKAASVQEIDSYICNGYGRTLRKILRKYYEGAKSDLPVTLGRDCTGIVTDVGKNVTRIEIGDEVWLTVPFWAQGTISQTVLVNELHVGKIPKNIRFEGACSVPYAGCLALGVLEKSHVTFENAQDKRVLVHKGCTPVGCVLIQILKHWGAEVTATCNERALPVAKALGSDEIIILSDHNNENSEFGYKSLIKELELREKYDVIILTSMCSVPVNELQKYCKCNEIHSTVPQRLDSDGYGFFRQFLLNLCIWLGWRLEVSTDVALNKYAETHMCHSTLDQLASLIKNGHLQTVVDRVFQPHNIDSALAHIASSQSIGSSVITFR